MPWMTAHPEAMPSYARQSKRHTCWARRRARRKILANTMRFQVSCETRWPRSYV